MGRCTELLTLFFSQPCLANEEMKMYAEIRHVESRKDERLSWSKGNVNLTDYWYSMVDVFLEQDLAYTCQHIDLLCDDKEGESEWWQKQLEAGRVWICFCFLKWKRDREGYTEMEATLKMDDKDHRYFYTMGNADCIYVFSAESEELIKEKLDVLKQQELFFFSRYYFYGQCSKRGEKKWKIDSCLILDGGFDKHLPCTDGWGVQTAKRLREAICSSREARNKKMVAYYHALGQIANVIGQYEQSPAFKYLYYMLYPSFQLFCEQLTAAEDILNDNYEGINKVVRDRNDVDMSIVSKIETTRKMEIAISDFIDSMETLLHHMGQSCRDILTEAGHGGMPYDIPIHLCMIYKAYLGVLTSIINDNNYKFEYCLVPLAYSRPITEYFDFNLSPEKGRLIKVQISRHMMFMPRSLLIILAHEVSHYVSEKPRLRKLRAECFVNIINMAMVERMIPSYFLRYLDLSEMTEEQNNLLIQYVESIRRRVYTYFQENVWEIWKSKNQKEKYPYHFQNLLKSLENVCRDILVNDNLELNWNIEYVDIEFHRELRESNSFYRNIITIQNALSERAKALWNDQDLRDFINQLCTNMRECYADLLGSYILGTSWKEYIEAYLISESSVPEKTLPAVVTNRFAMKKYLFGEDQVPGWESEESQSGSADPMNHHNETPENQENRNIMDEFFRNVDEQIREYLDAYRSQDEPDESQNLKQEDQVTGFSINEEKTDLFFYRDIIAEELRYLRKCYSQIKVEFPITDADLNEKILTIRKLYQHFLVKEKGKDSSYRDFFSDSDRLIQQYKSNIELMKK